MLALPVLEVRRFREEDAARVGQLGRQAFFEFSRTPGRSTLEMARRNTTLVATLNDEPVGLAILAFGKPAAIAELLALAVQRAQRGRGIGVTVLLAAEQLVRARQGVKLRAHSADFNLAALELFLKHGYRIVRRCPRYYLGRFDACELEKRL
jgi:ribosomal protein S18 acetylase RimI-like enzyme